MARARRKPSVIVCPNCNVARVYRRNYKCSACGVHLWYIGDYIWPQTGYFWHPDKGWLPTEDVIRNAAPKNKKT